MFDSGHKTSFDINTHEASCFTVRRKLFLKVSFYKQFLSIFLKEILSSASSALMLVTVFCDVEKLGSKTVSSDDMKKQSCQQKNIPALAPDLTLNEVCIKHLS